MSLIENQNVNHPIWEVYDYFRTTRYRVKIYELKIHYNKRLDSSFNIAIAIFTPSSALASYFSDYQFGDILWKSLISIASVFAVVKPFLHLEQKLKDLYRSVGICEKTFLKLNDLRIKINENKKYTRSMMNDFSEIREDFNNSTSKILLVNVSKRLGKKVKQIVNNEYPVNRFFIPEM